MMRTLACILLALPMVWAVPQNLTTTMTGIGTVSFSSVSITSSTPMRLEIAYDSFSVAASDSAPIIGIGPSSSSSSIAFRRNGTSLECVDNLDGGGNGNPSVDLNNWDSAHGNYGFSARCERDPGTGTVTMMVCRMDGTNCTTDRRTATAFGSATVAGGQIGRAGWGAGNNSIYGQLALFRFSTTLAGTTNPPNAHNAPTGNVLDWEFDGSITDSVRSATWSLNWGSAGYTSTVSRLPVCNAGTTKILRAGVPATLDGTKSYALDGGTTLTAVWQQTAGPTTAVFSHTAVSPTLTGLVFGQYDFQMSVSDASGGKAGPCAVSHGVPATDANGNLIISNSTHAWILGQSDPTNPEARTGSPSLLGSDFAADGTGIRAYPFFSSQIPINADAVMTQMRTAGGTGWLTPAAGTISFINTCTSWSTFLGSSTCSTITGSGTAFQTAFCGGPGSSTPNGKNIVIWYTSSLNPGTTGHRAYPVKSCTDNTHLVLGQSGGSDFSFVTEAGVVDGTQNTGLNYAIWDTSVTGGWWYNQNASGAYYDAPKVYLWLYYATGLTKWRDAFREYADNWFSMPYNDGGAQYVLNAGWWGTCLGETRCSAIETLILRAADGRPEMWPGIRRWMLFFYNDRVWNPFRSGIIDLRDHSYMSLWLAEMALFDPVVANRGTDCTGGKPCWYQKVKDFYTNQWTPYKIQHGSDIWWVDHVGSAGGASSTGLVEYKKAQGGSVYTGTANVTNGSASVTGTGTNFNTSWTYNDSTGQTDTFSTRAAGINGCDFIWFTDAANTSVYQSTYEPNGDVDAYKVASITSNTAITLARAYTGTSGSKNYVCVGSGDPALGYNNTMISIWQPYMLMINAQAHWWAHEAALSQGDSTLAATASTYAQGAAQSIYDYAYDTTTGGHTYFEGTPTANGPDHCYTCDSINGPGDQPGMRINSIENYWAYGLLYRLNPSAPLLAEIDTRYGKAYGKPGTGGIYTDGVYLQSMDNGWKDPSAQFIQKWLGYVAGTGNNQAWFSARTGGLASAQARTMKVTARIADHPQASKMRVAVIDPQGNATTTTCTSSPCTITTPDARQGAHLYRVDLLNSSDAVVLAGDYVPLSVQ
jgi:hypothetical protein